jgi:beta-N-acetylhexosaminidase
MFASGSGGSPAARALPGGQAAIATVITATSPGPAPAAAAAPHPFVPAPAARRSAATLTLPQQVAQLFVISRDGTGAPAGSGLGSTPWGGVMLTRANFSGDRQVAALSAAVASAAHTAGGVPPLVAATQQGGPGTAFPDLPPEGETQIGTGGSPALARSQAQAAGRALRALGVQMTIAPWADVDTLQGALTGRLFSSDPAAVARFSLAAAEGYRSAGIIAGAAHFPGEGGASADPDQTTATVGGSLAQLEDRDLIPFAAIVAQVPVMMMSNAEYTAFDGVTPAGLLPAAVRLLRSRYGFTGVVMTDDLDAAAFATGQTPGQVAVRALTAGDDLLYISGAPSESAMAYTAVLALAQRSAAARTLVHDALLRDLTLKAHFGLLRSAPNVSTATTG